MICKADAEIALIQITESIRGATQDARIAGEGGALASKEIQQRRKVLTEEHRNQILAWEVKEASRNDSSSVTVPQLFGTLRKALQDLTPSKVLILNETVTNYPHSWNHLRPETPGDFLASGGSSLGWSLGAAVGAYLGARVADNDYDLAVVIVGDGSYMFCVPSSAFWMARKYQTVYLISQVPILLWLTPTS
jgi:thiamine pyrophosphate-dependent acetolactate synthase large subunit-like protein